MSKFIEVDGWEYSDGDKIQNQYLLNLNHLVTASVREYGWNEGVEYTLSSGQAFYVFEETHERILDILRENGYIED